ncbi:MAG: hypothetical protein USCAAHI_00968 [Beijerinckiaceae bacterium]|nr:MAG: hypothetical protein USCAAHI_00968 [Beijerinckiaceae bacterium]
MAVEFLDAQIATAHIVAQLVIMVDIPAEHPHQIIDPAADFVAFQDFIAFADGGQKTLEIGFPVIFEDNLDEKHHRAGNFRKFEVGNVASYQTRLFERFDPLQAGARRQMHSFREVDIADSRVELQPLQDFEVHFVDHMPVRHGLSLSA